MSRQKEAVRRGGVSARGIEVTASNRQREAVRRGGVSAQRIEVTAANRQGEAVRRGSAPVTEKDAVSSGRQESRPWPGFGLAALGALFMAFGIYRGEMPIVLQKAINICMECIGIG